MPRISALKQRAMLLLIEAVFIGRGNVWMDLHSMRTLYKAGDYAGLYDFNSASIF